MAFQSHLTIITQCPVPLHHGKLQSLIPESAHASGKQQHRNGPEHPPGSCAIAGPHWALGSLCLFLIFLLGTLQISHVPYHLNLSRICGDSGKSIIQWQKKMVFLENNHSMVISNMNSWSLKIQLVLLQILHSQHLSPAVVSLQNTVPRTEQGHPSSVWDLYHRHQIVDSTLPFWRLNQKLFTLHFTSSPFLEAFVLSYCAGSMFFSMMDTACAFHC